MSRAIAPLATLAAIGLGWLAWENLGLLRGTWAWELRFVAFACLVFLLLTLAERLAGWLTDRLRRRLGR